MNTALFAIRLLFSNIFAISNLSLITTNTQTKSIHQMSNSKWLFVSESECACMSVRACVCVRALDE